MIRKLFCSLALSAMLAISAMAAEAPIFTFACFSDVHNQQTMINASVENIYIRTAFTSALQQIKATEEVDLIVLGGDYTSDVTISQAQWEQVRQLMVDSTRAFFPEGARTPVIYVNGNHDYEVANFDALPKTWNAGDYYNFPMKVDIGTLDASECFYENAYNNNGTDSMSLLAAYHYVVNGFDFVVLNTGKYFFASAWDYQYSERSAKWVADKLDEIYASDPDKTVFVLMHLPFADSKGAQASKGIALSLQSTKILKAAYAKHPNLICLYGHDHSSSQLESYIKSETAQRVTQYDSNGDVYVEPGAPALVTDWYIQSVASNQYLGFDSYNMCVKSTVHKFTAASSTLVSGNITLFGENAPTDDNGYVHCGSSGRFSGNPDKTMYSSIYLYEISESGGNYVGTKVTWPEHGKTYAIVALSSAGGYYALTNTMYNSGSTAQRMIGVSTTNGSSITLTTNTALWKFIDPTVQKVYYIQDQNGDYLDFSGNLVVVPAASGSQGFNFLETTCTSSTYTSTSSLHIKILTNSQYVHCGSNGKFSGNSVIGNNNTSTSLWLYKVEGTTATRVAYDQIVSGGKYLIVGLKSGTYYQLLNTDNGASGNDIRMNSESLGTSLGSTFTYNNNVSALWTITEKEDDAAGTPSFISSFMGSMRYNSLATNSSPGVNDSPIVQALLVYVYKDSVVLSMKNYGQTGYISGSAISTTIAEPLAPYTSERTIDVPDFSLTVAKQLGSGSATDGVVSGSGSGTYGVYDKINVTAADGENDEFIDWQIVFKSNGTTIATKNFEQFYEYIGQTVPTNRRQLKFKQAEWSALLKQLGLQKVDIEITAIYSSTVNLNTIPVDKFSTAFVGDDLVVEGVNHGDNVSLYDVSGKCILCKNADASRFVTSACAAHGVYIVKIRDTKGRHAVLRVLK